VKRPVWVFLFGVAACGRPETLVRQPATREPIVAATKSAPPPVASAPRAEPGAEATLGVADRGIYPDLDRLLELPPPAAGQTLGAVVDPSHALLVVYADDWPVKVYPLGGSAELDVGGTTLKLRPGDRAELVARLRGGSISELKPGEFPPPGDADGDGIPDPLDVLIGAHKAVLAGASYSDQYFNLDYPNGDPPRDKGACVDVIVRAVRNAGIDLQSAMIEDERAAKSSYGLDHVDPNIDHRRVKNAIVYFERHWQPHSAAVDDAHDPLRPGDVVFLDTFPDRPGPDHVGIVSEKKGRSGYPLVINLWTFGYKTQAMDLLGSVPVTERFRFPSRR
jgi:uncharacterized protein YijF (DUF1287 family)